MASQGLHPSFIYSLSLYGIIQDNTGWYETVNYELNNCFWFVLSNNIAWEWFAWISNSCRYPECRETWKTMVLASALCYEIQKHYTDWKPFEWYVLVLLTDSEVISLMWDFVYLCFSRLCLSLVFCINGSIHVLYCFSVCLLTWRRQWLKISHLVWTDAFSISLRLLWSWPKWGILKTGSRFGG